MICQAKVEQAQDQLQYKQPGAVARASCQHACTPTAPRAAPTLVSFWFCLACCSAFARSASRNAFFAFSSSLARACSFCLHGGREQREKSELLDDQGIGWSWHTHRKSHA